MTKQFGTTVIADKFSMRILRGDRIGLVGPNGAGKTTLLRLMLGTLAPDHGTVRIGTKVSAAYFDQMREALDPDKHADRNDQPGFRLDRNRRRAQARDDLPWRLPVSAAARRSADQDLVRRRTQSIAACPACLRNRPTCWCLTSRPTISISSRLNCSRRRCSSIRRHAAAGESRSRISRQRRHANTGRRRQWSLARVRWWLFGLVAATARRNARAPE